MNILKYVVKKRGRGLSPAPDRMNNFNFVAIANLGGFITRFGYHLRVDRGGKMRDGDVQFPHQFSKCFDGIDLSFLSVDDKSQRF